MIRLWHLMLGFHRAATRPCLRWMLRRQATGSPYKPLEKRMLYVAASALPYHTSGYTIRTQAILQALAKLNCEVSALTRPGYPWDRKDRLSSPDADVTVLGGVSYSHARYPSRQQLLLPFAARAAHVTARKAIQDRVALIHAASDHVNALPALLAAKRLGIPFQYEMRGLWQLSRASRLPGYENSPDFLLGLELEGLVAQHAQKVFVISEQLGKFAQDRWQIPPERISLLPNCMDTGSVRSYASAPPFPQSIGYAGSLITYEGLDMLIKAVGILVTQGKPVQAHIIGDGEARAELEELSRRLQLTDRIHFWGKRSLEEARGLLQQCSLACIPRKPFKVCEIIPPLKLVEALGMGKPLIVSDLPVLREELGPDPAAFFCKAGQADDLARVISLALADPGRLAELGEKAKRYIAAERQWHKHVLKILPSGCKVT